MTQNECKNYLRDYCFLIIEKAFDAKKTAESLKGSEKYDYHLGRKMAFYETISLLQQQAVAFGIPLNEIGLSDIDPEKDLL